jgi:GPH family glycoside/pentoside/hexuronide:cation symporter
MTSVVENAAPNRLPLGVVLGLCMANPPIAALSVAVLVYLPPYFAGHLKVAMAVVGGVWMAIRLIDIPVDVLLALAMDRTRTPVGRYRPWLVAGAPVIMLGLYQLYMAPVGFSGGYLLIWLLVLYLGWSMMSLAQSAWAATLAPDYHDRSRLFGVMTAMGVIGTLAVLLLPIMGRRLGWSDAESIRSMGWAMIVATPLGAAIAAIRTPERIARATAPRPFPLRDYLAILRKPDLLRLLLAQVGLTLGPGWMSALYLFFAADAKGFSIQPASILLALYVAAGFPGALAVAALARRIGKHRALIVTTTAFSLGLVSILFVPRGDVAAAAAPMVWAGATSAGFGLMIQAMLADLGDEFRLEQGKERMSLLYALNGLAQKIATAFSIGLTFPLLARLGYKAAEGSVNTPAAIHNLTVAFIAGPIVFVMLAGACVVGWRLDATRHGEVRRALDAREALQS